jgi:hypothetical protein
VKPPAAIGEVCRLDRAASIDASNWQPPQLANYCSSAGRILIEINTAPDQAARPQKRVMTPVGTAAAARF